MLASFGMFATLLATAQSGDSFNSRDGVTTSEVKALLQNHCWSFPDFDVNQNGWNPEIEGDGAMVSGPGSSSTSSTGIYTPVLDVPGVISISFKYKFNSSFSSPTRRWIKIYLVNHENEIQSELDNVEFSNVNATTVYSYSKTFTPVGSGAYKVYINYQGTGGETRIAIDELIISAPQLYASGCNDAPVANNDHFTGTAQRRAAGQLCSNDHDSNGDSFDCYMITGSPDGTVTINPDHSFQFTPNPGFTGNSTQFTYQICDHGFGPLCSNEATVTIQFPSGGFLPVSMIDFTGVYRDNGKVEITWTTTFEENSDKFVVERSFDGTKWETVGSLKAQGTSSTKKLYSFIDEVGKNTANRKDLYYRLKLADLDGKVNISRILVVRVYNTQSTKMISVSPNPAKNDIVATLQLNQTSVVVLKVVNNTGVEMMRKTKKLEAGINKVMMDGTSQLKPGLYILEVIVNSKERMMVKLVKE